MTRLENSLKNGANALLGYTAKLAAAFICRSVFLRVLNADYLGLNGLFHSILSILSLMELGMGTAVGFSLYKPLAENDQDSVRALMAFLKKAYLLVGALVAAAGLALIPLLPHLMNGEPPEIENLTVIYILFVIKTALSYFYNYKRVLIIADQKQYIVSRRAYGCAVAMSAAQIALLLITRAYIPYLLAAPVFMVLENVIITRRADKMYPYLISKKPAELPPGERAQVLRNIKAMMFHRVGGAAVASTDSLLLSRLVGLASVGKYANYQLLTQFVHDTMELILSGLAASIGNLGATADDGAKRSAFDRLRFCTWWLYGFFTIAMLCLLNPFITLWAGEAYLFPAGTVLLICLQFFLTGVRKPVMITKQALGIYWQDRYRPLAEGAINLIVSVVLGLRMGVNGVLLGTTVSFVLTNLWVEPLMLYRHGLHAPLGAFIRDAAVFSALTALLALAAQQLCALMPGGVTGLLLRAAIAVVLPNAVYLVCFSRRAEFSYFKQLIFSLARRAAGRGNGRG